MRKILRQIILISGDTSLLYLSLLLTLLIGFWSGFNWRIFLNHLLPFSILYSLWLIIFYIFGFYDLILPRSIFVFYTRILIALGVAFSLGIAFFYLLPVFGISPKTNLFLDVFIFGIFFTLWRNSFNSIFSRHFLVRVSIIGQGEEVDNLKRKISNSPYLGYKLIEINLREDLFDQVEKKNIDTIIFTKDFEADQRLLKILYLGLPERINFLDFSTAYEIITEKIPLSMISHSWFLENLKEGDKVFYDKLKRIADIALAFIILLLTSPFWLLIAILIRTEDGGPVFYSQERVGKNRKRFRLIKFRSMVVDAEKEGAKWAEREDKRVTRIGRILRQIHLDEVPQMLNIIRGDISLVGPRPERPEFVVLLEKKIPYYQLRHLIKPGFTGWAQIKFRYGRSMMDSYEKFQYDLYYLKNRSVFLDTRILLKTFQLFFKKG